MYLKVVSGPMFLGKTEKLIHRARKAKRFGIAPLVIRHVDDNRYTDKPELCTHDGQKYPCVELQHLDEILQLTKDDVVMEVDEFFMFEGDPIAFFKELVKVDIDITVYGLDLDSNGETWPNMDAAHAYADTIEKVIEYNSDYNALRFTQKLISTGNKKQVGGKDDYKVVTAEDWIPLS